MSEEEREDLAARVVCRLCKIWPPEVVRPWYNVAVPMYLQAADEAGLLTKDFLRRLKGRDDGEFRGAVGECLAAWFVERQLQPLGFEQLRATQADMRLRLPGGQEVNVEVKAPFPMVNAHPDEDGFGYGAGLYILKDVLKKLAGACGKAKGPLRKCADGLLFVALPASVAARFFLGEAFHCLFGKREQGVEWISGVLGVRECLGQEPIAVEGYLLHNPFATRPLATDIWGDIPQCLFRKAQDSHVGLDWSWSDGERF